MYTWHDLNIDTQKLGHLAHILAHSIFRFFISPYLIYQVGPQPPCQIKEECKWFYQAV